MLTAQEGGGQGEAQAPTGQVYVTLAVDAAAAERVVFASNYGDIWLAVQPADADESGTQVQSSDRIFG